MKQIFIFRKTYAAVILIGYLMAFSSAMAQQMPRRNALRETNNEFFKTEEARRIGNQVLAFQRCTGGWPKNIDMTQKMSNEELAQVLKEKSRRNDSTIDNGATTMQMIYLARLYRQTNDVRYRDAFRLAVEYLLNGQYENGGCRNSGRKCADISHITFNDDAIVNTLEILHDIMSADFLMT
jgi:hypothetical protein